MRAELSGSIAGQAKSDVALTPTIGEVLCPLTAGTSPLTKTDTVPEAGSAARPICVHVRVAIPVARVTTRDVVARKPPPNQTRSSAPGLGAEGGRYRPEGVFWAKLLWLRRSCRGSLPAPASA